MTSFNRTITALAVVLVLSAGLSYAQREALAQQPAPMAAEAEYAAAGAKTCMKCHDTAPVTLILGTQHAVRADPRTPFANHDCETCHGPSPEHMIKPKEGEKRAEPKIVFGAKSPTSTAREQNQVCLTCHESGVRINWRGSPHFNADVACVSCHDIHTAKQKVLLRATQPEVCFTCHFTQRAQVHRFSHHPILEGQVSCSDCHNPHGAFGPKLLKKATLNETCYECHAEKRGPFLWEHAPVREDCTNCHTPHGSAQPRLLKARPPQLCQRCHSAAFHPSTLYSGTGIPPVGAVHQLLVKGCLNCHSQVHGSNHPSGVIFMR